MVVNDHEVKFNITFNSFENLVVGTAPTSAPSLGYASLYVDYIYLDTDERRQFAQVQHEYLIEQLQYTGAESFTNTSVKSKLALNHPCKELIWVAQPNTNISNKHTSIYGVAGAGSYPTFPVTQSVVDAKLQLNGHDRFSIRSGDYFNLVQPYQHHTRIPDTGIYVYSFALNPEQHQPSGTVNMSRIDNATLMLTLWPGVTSSGCQLRVYAVNYNVLRVMSGMGGLAYSNWTGGLAYILSLIPFFSYLFYLKIQIKRPKTVVISPI